MQHNHLGLCDSISHATFKHKSHGLVIGFIDFPSPVSDAGEKDLLTPRYGRSCLSHAEVPKCNKAIVAMQISSEALPNEKGG